MSEAAAALAAWGLGDAPHRLVSHRENRVYAVDLPSGGRAALRLHRAGYHDRAALLSELWFMNACADAGLPVPRSIAAADGRLLVAAAGNDCDLLTWLPGTPIAQAGAPLAADAPERYRALGRALAALHRVADGWAPPAGFVRPAWNAAGLVGAAPLWGRFWDNPALTAGERACLIAARDRARAWLAEHERAFDYGLIHADAVRENVLIRGGAAALIDFDDCGWGFRLFDLATALHPLEGEAGFDGLRTALLDGYRSLRPLTDADEAALPAFLMLRGLTYVGWIATRMDVPGAAARQRRAIDTACARAAAWAR
ncbi:MAG: phosphotransferase enzyme family protein [Gemmobacter sp.]